MMLETFKTDLIVRRVNLDRYDDREDVRTNLIESFDRIMAFSEKHLPDPFYLEGSQRVSLRSKIMREIASNVLIHREYMHAHPAKIIFEKNRIFCENANRPHFRGNISLKDFTPFPKNPTIARIFKEIGLADELGSGVRNLLKYVKIYSDDEPVFIEEDIFKIIIPFKEDLVNQHSEDKSSHKTVEKTVEKIIYAIKENPTITINELVKITGLSRRGVEWNIEKLKQQGKLKRIGSDKGGYWEVIL
ncbi:winged helix-turn-helix transcriptional regulator [Thermospira aquatica]|uniref:Winged helix-turn-helix transcriptional regulator n=1 Tax=Thermospira aquatica TaxID=2828656 RepID=A0AAX3BDM2_9SPIR|nr:winged helix-turn-helix transcriptional regulator [Thermospira aquatica]URA10320.1 winged helix-turn-helix transcriptional regulator [Thermospira aquatica]